MAPKGVKRTSVAPASPSKRRSLGAPPSSPAKRKERDPLTSVTLALEKASTVPKDVAKMLGDISALTLKPAPKDGRHPYQEAFIEMIDSVLKGVELDLTNRIAQSEEIVQGAMQIKDDRDAAVPVAEGKQLKCAEVVSDWQGKHDIEQKAIKELRRELEDAKKKQKDCTSLMETTAENLAALEKARDQHFVHLRASSANVPEGKASVAALEKIGRALGWDESLLLSLPAAFAKAPEERSDFCLMALERVEKHIHASHNEMTIQMGSSQTRSEELVAKINETEQMLNTHLMSAQTIRDSLKVASDDEKNARQEVEKARKAARDFLPEMEAKCNKLDKLKAEVTIFRAGPLAGFEGLKRQPEESDRPEENNVIAENEGANEVAVEGIES